MFQLMSRAGELLFERGCQSSSCWQTYRVILLNTPIIILVLQHTYIDIIYIYDLDGRCTPSTLSNINQSSAWLNKTTMDPTGHSGMVRLDGNPVNRHHQWRNSAVKRFGISGKRITATLDPPMSSCLRYIKCYPKQGALRKVSQPFSEYLSDKSGCLTIKHSSKVINNLRHFRSLNRQEVLIRLIIPWLRSVCLRPIHRPQSLRALVPRILQRIPLLATATRMKLVTLGNTAHLSSLIWP